MADRVLYVMNQAKYSGAELLHLPLLRSDPDALLVCPPGSPTEELARSEGIETAPLPFRVLRHSGGALETVRSAVRGVLAARDLRALIRKHPDRTIIYGTAIRPGMIAAVGALGLGRRVVWYVPDRLPPRGPVRLLVSLVARLADTVIAISNYVAEDAGPQTKLGQRMAVIPPGVDAGRFSSSEVDPGAAHAVILGHVSPTKRTDLAIDIAERVAARAPEFRLRVVGQPQYRREDYELADELKRRVERDPRLRDRVSFSGFSSDVAEALKGAGMLLHCRDDEPFGLVLLEAMASGLPVVAPRAGGALEIVEHGVTGLLFGPGDAEEGAAAVLTLLSDPERARGMGDAGRERVRSRYDAERQAQALATAIRSG